MSKNLRALSARKGLEDGLFEQLRKAAQHTGTPEVEDIQKLADSFHMGPANVLGAASFYDFLKPENRGKEAYVCNGSACLLAGTQGQVKEALRRHLSESEIGEICCLGRCHENGAFQVGDKNYSKLQPEQIREIFEGPRTTAPVPAEDHYFVGGNPRILTAAFPGVAAFFAPLKELLGKEPEALEEEIRLAGLRGRGGAAYPFANKLASCRNTEASVKYVVCNADEGDPGSYSDRYLLEQQPHLVLFGMLMTGYIIGAHTGVLYIRAEYPHAIETIEKSLYELEHGGWVGNNILDSGFDFQFKIVRAAGSYVCGEETALLSSLEGQRPEVRLRPPYPAQSGLFGQPTVVANVETLASLSEVLVHGGKHYASLGKAPSTGTKLVSLDGHFNRPGVYEVPMGTPLSKVLYEWGQGFKAPFKALHIGGPLGGVVPKSKINALTLDFESFREHGFSLGHASIITIPYDFPMVEYLLHLFEFTAHESCGKCYPCRIGSTRGKELLQGAAKGDGPIDSGLFEDLLLTLEQGSLCGLGYGLPLPVRNILTYFPEELKGYFKRAPL